VFSYVPRHEDIWGTGRIASSILNLGTWWRCGQVHAPAALPPGKGRRYPLDRRMGGPHCRSGCGSEEKNPCPFRESNPVVQPVA